MSATDAARFIFNCSLVAVGLAIFYILFIMPKDEFASAAKKKFKGRMKFKGELTDEQKMINWVESESFWLEKKSQEFRNRSQWFKVNALRIAGDNNEAMSEVGYLMVQSDNLLANADLTQDVEWLLEEPSIPNAALISQVVTGLSPRLVTEAKAIKQVCTEITLDSRSSVKVASLIRSISRSLEDTSYWMSTESARLRTLNIAAAPTHEART